MKAKVDFCSEVVDSTDMVIFRYTPKTNVTSRYVVSCEIMENGNILDRLDNVVFEGISSTNPIEFGYPQNVGAEYKNEMQIKDEYGSSIHNSVMSILRKHIDENENSEKMFTLAFGSGEWFEYEVVDAINSTLYGVTIQNGDRVRYEIVGTGVKQKRSFDFETVLTHQVPLCDVYVNGDKIVEKIYTPVVYPNSLRFWEEYQMIEANWITEFAKTDPIYDSEIQFGTKEILIEFSFEGIALSKVFVDKENGTVLDLESTVDLHGIQMSYHIVHVSSSLANMNEDMSTSK